MTEPIETNDSLDKNNTTNEPAVESTDEPKPRARFKFRLDLARFIKLDISSSRIGFWEVCLILGCIVGMVFLLKILAAIELPG